MLLTCQTVKTPATTNQHVLSTIENPPKMWEEPFGTQRDTEPSFHLQRRDAGKSGDETAEKTDTGLPSARIGRNVVRGDFYSPREAEEGLARGLPARRVDALGPEKLVEKAEAGQGNGAGDHDRLAARSPGLGLGSRALRRDARRKGQVPGQRQLDLHGLQEEQTALQLPPQHRPRPARLRQHATAVRGHHALHQPDEAQENQLQGQQGPGRLYMRFLPGV